LFDLNVWLFIFVINFFLKKNEQIGVVVVVVVDFSITVFGFEYIVARADADEMARNNSTFLSSQFSN
jgi:hypothetical protein